MYYSVLVNEIMFQVSIQFISLHFVRSLIMLNQDVIIQMRERDNTNKIDIYFMWKITWIEIQKETFELWNSDLFQLCQVKMDLRDIQKIRPNNAAKTWRFVCLFTEKKVNTNEKLSSNRFCFMWLISIIYVNPYSMKWSTLYVIFCQKSWYFFHK